MNKIFLVVVLLIAITINTDAQSKFCGNVVSNGNAVEFAVVKCLSNNAAVLGNINGEFCFDNLPKGLLTFELSCLGYNKKIVDVVIPNSETKIFELQQGTYQSNEIIISATRASDKQASTFQIINKKEIEKLNIGQDLPYIFQYTPSTVTTSDAGAGVGYTSMRIRGTDGTRINTTVNGVPVNDAESQGTFFVNFPDLVSSAQSIQIQRGVGTSSNGSGAFGASINMQTLAMRDSAYAQSNNSVGSFNTLKNTVMFGTGLINNNFTLNGRLSRIVSDGFIDRASSNMRSLYLDASYYGKRFSMHYVNFSGLEKTYQAWNGVPETKVKSSSENDTNLVNHYYNNLGYLYNSAQDSLNIFNSKNNNYNY
jgi:iron complex outermembrane receptor protein